MWYRSLITRPFAVYLLVGTLLIGMLSATSARRSRRACLNLQAAIYPKHLRFITHAQLLAWADRYAKYPIIGHPTAQLSLQDIETQLKNHPFIRKVEVYRSHPGDIGLYLHQAEPLTRLIYNQGHEQYLTKQGTYMPLSSQFTARVPLLYVPYLPGKLQNHWQNKKHPLHEIWLFVAAIATDPFWTAQIADIRLNKAGEMHFHTQLSKQAVYFGTPADRHTKLKKLQLFYTHILPQKGWNKYEKVDLRFKNQIVCN